MLTKGRTSEEAQVAAVKYQKAYTTYKGFVDGCAAIKQIAAGQDSHSVSLHPIDPATGIPGTPLRFPTGKNPNWVEIVDMP